MTSVFFIFFDLISTIIKKKVPLIILVFVYFALPLSKMFGLNVLTVFILLYSVFVIQFLCDKWSFDFSNGTYLFYKNMGIPALLICIITGLFFLCVFVFSYFVLFVIDFLNFQFDYLLFSIFVIVLIPFVVFCFSVLLKEFETLTFLISIIILAVSIYMLNTFSILTLTLAFIFLIGLFVLMIPKIESRNSFRQYLK